MNSFLGYFREAVYGPGSAREDYRSRDRSTALRENSRSGKAAGSRLVSRMAVGSWPGAPGSPVCWANLGSLRTARDRELKMFGGPARTFLSPVAAADDSYSGMFPCFLGGFLARLFSSMSSAWISLRRVSRGRMTASRYPRSAAMYGSCAPPRIAHGRYAASGCSRDKSGRVWLSKISSSPSHNGPASPPTGLSIIVPPR